MEIRVLASAGSWGPANGEGSRAAEDLERACEEPAGGRVAHGRSDSQPSAVAEKGSDTAAEASGLQLSGLFFLFAHRW